MRTNALLLAIALTPGLAWADCASPPSSWRSDWSAYASWCRGCCGTFVRSGTQSRCDPGSNWGCGGAPTSGRTVAPAPVPTTMPGAVLQGVQSGIQQGLQDAAQRRQRQQAENDRQLQRMISDGAALELDAAQRAEELELRRRAAAKDARREEEEKAKDIAGGMKGLGKGGGLKPKDLTRRGSPKPGGAAAALACAAAETYARLESLGPTGRELARGLRAELAAVLSELAAKPPSGRSGAVSTVSVGRDLAGEGQADGSQAVVSVLVVRDEATAEVRLDVQSSVRAPGAPERSSQVLAVLDRSGRVLSSEGSPEAEACLGRLAR